MENDAIIKLITSVVGSGVLAVFWKKLVQPYVLDVRARRNERWKKLDEIHKEMQMDGNGSMKTAVSYLKHNTDKILWRLDGLEETQKLSMNIQNICYSLADENGEWSYASPGICKLLGRSEKDLQGNNWISWVVPADKERVFHSWNFSVANVTVFDEHFLHKRADGALQQVWGLGFPKLVQGKHEGIMVKLEAVGEPYKPGK